MVDKEPIRLNELSDVELSGNNGVHYLVVPRNMPQRLQIEGKRIITELEHSPSILEIKAHDLAKKICCDELSLVDIKTNRYNGALFYTLNGYHLTSKGMIRIMQLDIGDLQNLSDSRELKGKIPTENFAYYTLRESITFATEYYREDDARPEDIQRVTINTRFFNDYMEER